MNYSYQIYFFYPFFLKYDEVYFKYTFFREVKVHVKYTWSILNV